MHAEISKTTKSLHSVAAIFFEEIDPIRSKKGKNARGGERNKKKGHKGKILKWIREIEG